MGRSIHAASSQDGGAPGDAAAGSRASERFEETSDGAVVPFRPSCAVSDRLCAFLFETLDGVVPFDRIAIVGVESTDRLVQRAVRGRTPDRVIPAGYRGTLRRGSLASVLASGHPRILNRLRNYATHAEHGSPTHLLLEEGYEASLTCPLEHEGTAVGLLFFNTHAPGTYRPEHAEIVLRVATAVAALLAHAIDEAAPPSFDALTLSLAAIGREARAAAEEEVLAARLLDRVRGGMIVDEVLGRVYEHFGALLPYDLVGFAECDGERVVARWAKSSAGVHIGRDQSVPLSETRLGDVLETGTPRILGDLEAYLAKSPASVAARMLVRAGLRSAVVFTLEVASGPMGFLYFASRAPHAYSTAHVARMRRLVGPLAAALEKARLYEELALARARAEELLRMMMPDAIATRLQAGETDIADAREATVLFADLVGFTTWSTALAPLDLLHTLRALFARVQESAVRRGVARIRVLGDGSMAAAGLSDDRPDHVRRAALHALDIVDIVASMHAPDGTPLAARVGVHCGPVVAGVLGGSDLRYDVWGPSVSVAARLESHGAGGRVQVSAEAARRLEGHFSLEPRGEVVLKGIGPRSTFWLGPLPPRGS